MLSLQQRQTESILEPRCASSAHRRLRLYSATASSRISHHLQRPNSPSNQPQRLCSATASSHQSLWPTGTKQHPLNASNQLPFYLFQHTTTHYFFNCFRHSLVGHWQATKTAVAFSLPIAMLKPTIKLMLTIVPSRPRPRTNAPPVHQTTSVLPRECLTLAPPLAPFTSTCTFVHTDCNGYRLARPPKHDNSIADKSLSVRHSIARSELLLAFAFLPPSGRFRSNSAINAAFDFTRSASWAVLLRTSPTAGTNRANTFYIRYNTLSILYYLFYVGYYILYTLYYILYYVLNIIYSILYIIYHILYIIFYTSQLYYVLYMFK